MPIIINNDRLLLAITILLCIIILINLNKNTEYFKMHDNKYKTDINLINNNITNLSAILKSMKTNTLENLFTSGLSNTINNDLLKDIIKKNNERLFYLNTLTSFKARRAEMYKKWSEGRSGYGRWTGVYLDQNIEQTEKTYNTKNINYIAAVDKLKQNISSIPTIIEKNRKNIEKELNNLKKDDKKYKFLLEFMKSPLQILLDNGMSSIKSFKEQILNINDILSILISDCNKLNISLNEALKKYQSDINVTRKKYIDIQNDNTAKPNNALTNRQQLDKLYEGMKIFNNIKLVSDPNFKLDGFDMTIISSAELKTFNPENSSAMGNIMTGEILKSPMYKTYFSNINKVRTKWDYLEKEKLKRKLTRNERIDYDHLYNNYYLKRSVANGLGHWILVHALIVTPFLKQYTKAVETHDQSIELKLDKPIKNILSIARKIKGYASETEKLLNDINNFELDQQQKQQMQQQAAVAVIATEEAVAKAKAVAAKEKALVEVINQQRNNSSARRQQRDAASRAEWFAKEAIAIAIASKEKLDNQNKQLSNEIRIINMYILIQYIISVVDKKPTNEMFDTILKTI